MNTSDIITVSTILVLLMTFFVLLVRRIRNTVAYKGIKMTRKELERIHYSECKKLYFAIRKGEPNDKIVEIENNIKELAQKIYKK